MTHYEILDSVYDIDTEDISVFLGLKDIEEVNPPTTPLPGEPVEGIRWIRRYQEVFIDRDLEVHSTLVVPFTSSSVDLYLYDVSRLPNSGIIVLNRGSSTEETITYTGRDIFTNRLTGTSTPIYVHVVGELAYPSVDIDFLGAFEVDLELPFSDTGVHGPLRYGKSKVVLNDTINLREGIHYEVVNDFVGDICTRTRLRFNEGGQPRRFSPRDKLDVTYEFFVLYGDTRDYIQIYSSPGIVSWILLYKRGSANIAFGVLESIDRDLASVGNIRITPPFSNTVFPPASVKIPIPDIKLPINIRTTSPITSMSTEIPVTSVVGFPTPGTLIDTNDDVANRSIIINGDIISYTDIDKVNNLLVGVSGIAPTGHPTDSLVEFNGAKYIRDVVKDSINRSSLRGQIEAVSVDVGGYYIGIRIKGNTGSFNLQPGTYGLWYLGFDNNIDCGLHTNITSSTSFKNKDFTFEQYKMLIERQNIAKTLLGQTTSMRNVPIGTNPTDITFDTP